MDAFGPIGVAGLFAGILTYCDLDAVFDAPPYRLEWSPWLWLVVWWWGFILANAVLAGILFYALKDTEYLKALNPYVAAIVAGAGYTAIVRLQFTTIQVNGKNTPVGLETFYEGLKNLVHKRINRIIRVWRMGQCEQLATSDIAALRQHALLMVGSDALLTDERRIATTAWIEQIAGDGETPEIDRKRVLAVFIVTEQRS